MRVGWKLVGVASVAGAALASASGCSSGEHRSSASASEGNRGGGPFDGLTAIQLRDKAQAEMAALSTMTVTAAATQNGVS
jgi:hypothetical protein